MNTSSHIEQALAMGRRIDPASLPDADPDDNPVTSAYWLGVITGGLLGALVGVGIAACIVEAFL